MYSRDVQLCFPSAHLLFNLSFKTGSLTADWKLAHIAPIHKKGDKSDIKNYRPISLTNIISKLFEKCIHHELLLECQHLLHDTQHGFLPLKSCTTQLAAFSPDISVGLKFNNLIEVVYIPPLLHKMKIRKTNFASFWGRSV